MKTRKIEDIEKDQLEAKLEDSIFLRILDFGLGYPDGFSYSQLIDGLKLEGWERKIVDEYLEAAYKNAYNKRSEGIRGVVETPFFIVQQGPLNDAPAGIKKDATKIISTAATNLAGNEFFKNDSQNTTNQRAQQPDSSKPVKSKQKK